jgi:Heparan-alpha-glucosaminide N-acetyltransferase, catalytic
MTPDSPAPLPRSRTGRILGVDAARAIALAGMFATHILALHDDNNAPTITGLLADGRASALFAVLAGVGVALSSGGPRRPRDGRAHLAAACGLLVRGLLVGLLGLWLVGFDSPVAVILAYYGLLFLVATPLLRLPARALGIGAALCCALAPVLSRLLRLGLPDGPGDQPGLDALAHPGELFVTLALTGYYPVLTWTTYLLAGMAVGRLDLRRARVAVGLLVGGAVVAVGAAVGSRLLLGPGGGAAALGPAALAERNYGTAPTGSWWWLAIDAPHSGTPFDLAHTTGSALAVLGAMLLLARWSRLLVWVPAAVGAVPLTLYTLHVIMLSVDSGDGRPEAQLGWLWLAHVLAAVLIGMLLRLAGRKGPLETVVSVAGRSVRRAVDHRPAPATGSDPAAEHPDPPTVPIPVIPAQAGPTGRRPGAGTPGGEPVVRARGQ